MYNKTIALVIGNDDYPDHSLNNAVNDANSISLIFQRLGYDLILETNAGYISQNEAFVKFREEIKNYDIAIFYFAGHAIQINDTNYLTSVQTDFASEGRAIYTSLSLNEVISVMDRSGTKVNIIILDACRDDPFKASRSRGISQNVLAPVFAPRGTLIAFSTSPGQRAKDGQGANGLYTSALLEHILEPHLKIEELFKRVRGTVFTFSKGSQVSWEHTSLIGNFCFNNGQLVHSLNLPYSLNVIKDNQYVIGDSAIDEIISDLKSGNFYSQNNAVDSFCAINLNNIDKNQLFICGRLILRAAHQGSFNCINFVRQLEKQISNLSAHLQIHVINGICYDLYFNSEGSFRQNQINSTFFNEILNLIELPKFSATLEFLRDILVPYRQSLFYIPDIDRDGVVINIFAIETKAKDHINEQEVTISSVTLNGNDIYNEKTKDSSSEYYFDDIIRYHVVDKYLSDKLLIPLSKFKKTINISVEDYTFVNFPDSKIFLK
ncbi:caspase family protein [Dyadobacter diqingensis]|uniref:caspase family protein n=1 Tax=Dyadobacter diqingensis TaxID=2938121 RepID=UPI0020C19A38|nr:caspase family protein [Dyadobacter diqingensis]